MSTPQEEIQRAESILTPRLKSFIAWLGTGAGFLAVIWGLIWGIISMIPKPVSTESVPAVAAPETKGAPTTTVAVAKPVKVFKAPIKKTLALPEAVVQDQNQQVIAATQVRGNDRPQTVTTTINTATGESQSFVKEDPLPWFAVEPKGEARLSIGYRYDGSGMVRQVMRLGVTQDVVRIKALTGGVTATVDSDGHAFAGVGVAYRW